MAEGLDDDTWLFHLKRGDYSAWFRDGIKDPDLATETVAVEKSDGHSAATSRQQIKRLVEHRYTLAASPATPVSSRMASSGQRGLPPVNADNPGR